MNIVEWLFEKLIYFVGGVAIGVVLFLVIRLIWPGQLPQSSDESDGMKFETAKLDESPAMPPVLLQALEVDADEVKNRCDSVFVQEKGKFYTLDKIDSSLSDEYNIGAKIPGSNYASLCHFGADSRVLALGIFGAAMNAKDSELVKAGGGEVTLRPVEFVGWSLPIMAQTTAPKITILAVDQTVVLDGGVEVRDADGYLWTNYNDLPYDRIYIVSWTKDDVRHEVKMKANCRCYKTSLDADRAIHLAGEQVRDDNIVSYDLSSVPAGTYLVYGAYPIGIVSVE